MSYNQRSVSPRPSLASLRAPSRSGSNPPSPLSSPATGSSFAFPPPIASTTNNVHYIPPPNVSSTHSSFNPNGPPTSTSYTAAANPSRFQDALAASFPPGSAASTPTAERSSSRHQLTASDASDASFRFPPDSASPTGARGFESLQRAFGQQQHGGAPSEQQQYAPGSRGPSPGFGRGAGGGAAANGNGTLYEEPESFDGGYGGLADQTLRGNVSPRTVITDTMQRFAYEEPTPQPPTPQEQPSVRTGQGYGHSFGHAGVNSLGGGFGRPASMDMDAGDEADTSFDFLLSPPPGFDPASASARQFAAAAQDTPKGKQPSSSGGGGGGGGGRTFPAPLLLKSDRNRPFGTPASPVLGSTAPLVIPRKMSASTGSTTFSGSLPGTSSSPSHAQPKWGSSNSTVVGSMGPPSAPLDHPRSGLPYQQHRSQRSSTSSFTHGTSPLAYSHSSNPSNSSAASPVIGSSSHPPQGFGSAPSSSNSHHTPNSISETPPIAPQALLLHILSLRSASSQPMSLSQSQGPLSRSNTPLQPHLLNHARIRSAGSTNSDGEDHGQQHVDSSSSRNGGGGGVGSGRLDTVDLSHKRIAEVPIEVVEELKDEVEKLALGYNLLKDLPSHFGMLGSKLRYLNVRVNALTSFPQILCEMSSLEILDISRNKIKRLPTNPGTLVNLKVFSIAKNRVKRLPIWFSQMSHLKVLKIDHNPLEWPPKDITVFPSSGSETTSANGSAASGGGGGGGSSKIEDAEEMQRWLPSLQRWIRENSAREIARENARDAAGALPDRRRRPSVMSSQASDDERSGHGHDDSSSSTPRPSGMTRTESGRLLASPTISTSGSFPRPLRVTPPSTANGIPPPPTTTATIANQVTESPIQDDPTVRHGRNASHSTMQGLHPEARPSLRSKKSLPDLRQSHADILAERRTGGTIEEEERSMPTPVSTPPPPPPVLPPATNGPLRRLQGDRPSGIVHSNSARAALPTQSTAPIAPSPGPPIIPIPLPRSQSVRPAPVSTNDSDGAIAPLKVTKSPSPRPSPEFGISQRAEFDSKGKVKRSPDVDRGSPSGFDRNSGAYFRRLSMLPASTISKAVPVTLLQFADAIRGILFSLSQTYSALRQFVVFASQDRLPAPIARLMGTADGSMSELINALDRFDSLSRRGTPSPDIVRNIFLTCRDSVGTFMKLVGALGPQLSSLLATADVRYTRTLLLMLYGSVGEIANSWTAVSPLLAEMSSISDDPSLATLILQQPAPSPTNSTATNVSSRSAPTSNGGGPLVRTRSRTRRHAGSFSVEDVQLGAVLPPAPIPDLPPFSAENPFHPGINPSNPPSTSTSTSSLADFSVTNGGTVKARPNKSSRGPIPRAIAMPSKMGYHDMVAEAFDRPMTPGATGELIFGSQAGAATAVATPSAGGGPGGGGGGSNSMSTNGTREAGLSSSTSSLTTPTTSSTTSSLPKSEGGRPVSTANADATFVDMAESTITIARSIYGMLLDSFDADYDGVDDADRAAGVRMRELGQRRVKELTDLCILGNETTTKLRSALARVRAPDSRGPLKFSSSDAKRLGDEAYAFVQTVIRFAKLVKAISLEHGFAPRIREGVGQLTIATREFAKHLSHTSTSFRPSVPSSSSSSSTNGPSSAVVSSRGPP